MGDNERQGADLGITPGILDPREVVGEYVKNYDPELVQGNSLDLRVEQVFETFGTLHIFADGQRMLPEYEEVEPKDGIFVLKPGRVYQIEFMEDLELPRHICGITIVRSTMAKSGCSGENGLYDSGYCGSTGMMVTVGNEARIEKGASVAQILFLSANAGHSYNGFYQNSVSPLSWSR